MNDQMYLSLLIEQCGDDVYLDIKVDGTRNEARKIIKGPGSEATIIYGKGATILEALQNLVEELKKHV